jgi:ribonuclease P protein component
MGIAVSKKHGKAVARNRIKRLVRQAFFNCNQILKIPCDVVVLPKVAPVGVEYSLKDYEKSLITCLNKINSCEKIK